MPLGDFFSPKHRVTLLSDQNVEPVFVAVYKIVTLYKVVARNNRYVNNFKKLDFGDRNDF
jgi:hypothetical protein